MNELPTLDNPSVERMLGQIADEFTEQLKRGERPLIEDYARRYPDIAEVLRQVLPALQLLSASRPDAAAEMQPEGPLGDYRIVREIGRGGMGVVYEAVQISLGRRVALKVLPFAAAMDAKQLQRFKNEAQAAAHLQHQNIVPVYGVGCERGLHFYAMQYIEGQSLAQLIADWRLQVADLQNQADQRLDPAGLPPARDLLPANCNLPSAITPTPPVAALSTQHSTTSPAFFRTVARLGLQAAEALEHAHRLGVVHRDIKPGNLLLDIRGNLWVTDFGLARCRSDSSITLSGDLVGTLRYMSPEQALAKHWLLDHRTDIYSLGTTLYELLTLEPVFRGKGREDILRQIACEEPRRPKYRNKTIPAELETIVLKAMEKEAWNRYASAQELADDLRRFLDDKPIRARRPTLAQRAARWGRRHRGIVMTAAAPTLLGLVLGIAGLMLSNVRVRQEKVQAEAARLRAERNLALAMRALDSIYVRVAEKHSPRDPRREQQDRELLDLALGFYQELARENNADPQARKAVAIACFRIGDIQGLLGQDGPAKEAYERGLALSAEVTAECPTEYDVRVSAGTGRRKLAELLVKTGDRRAAAIHYQCSLELAMALTADFPAEPLARYDLACAHSGLGSFLLTAGAWAEAEDHFRQTVALEEQLAAEFPAVAAYRASLAAAMGNLANLLRQTGRPAEAETHCRRTLDLFARLAVEDLQTLSYREFEARAALHLAALLAHRDPGAAQTLYERALDLQTRLTAECPAVPEYRFQKADIHNMLGELLAEGRERAAAADHFRQARELGEKLAADFPKVPDYPSLLVHIQENLGRLARKTAERGAAQEHFGQALERIQQLAANFPNVPRYAENLARSHQNLSELLEDAGDWDEATVQDRHALAIWERLVAESPEVPRYRLNLALRHQSFGLRCHAQGEQVAAQKHFQQAVALWTDLVADPPPGKAGSEDREFAWKSYAWFLAEAPDPRWRNPERALELAQKAVSAAPTTADYWTILGIARYRAGKPAEALAALERAGQLRDLVYTDEQFFLAMIHQRQGAADKARQCFDEAVRTMEAGLPGKERLRRLRAEASALVVPAPHRRQGDRP